MMRAKEYLQQVKKLNTMIRNKEAEKAQWKSIALGITSFNGGDRVQSTSNPQKMADAIGKYIDIEAEINDVIDRLVDTKREIIATIEELPESEYDLLHKVYIQELTLKEAAFAMDKTYSNATTIHGRALVNVQNILDRKEKGNA